MNLSLVIPFIVLFAVFFGALLEAFFKLNEFEKRLDHISRTQVLFDGTLLREIARQVAGYREKQHEHEQEAGSDADVNRGVPATHDGLREGGGHISDELATESKSKSRYGEEVVGTRYHPHPLRECCVDGDEQRDDCPPRHLTRQLCEELRATDSMQQE